MLLSSVGMQKGQWFEINRKFTLEFVLTYLNYLYSSKPFESNQQPSQFSCWEKGWLSQVTSIILYCSMLAPQGVILLFDF